MDSSNRICLIYNYAQHYRENIFTLMDKQLPIDFVFGNKYLDVKKMDYSLLKNFRRELKNIKVIKEPFYYQKGAIKIFFNDYDRFLILGEPICLSTWGILLLSKIFNKHVYLWSHGWYGKEKYLKKIIKKFFFSLSDGIFLYGEYARNLMIKEGIKESKLYIIYNSLNYDEQIKIRENLLDNNIFTEKFQNGYKNLIFIGRLTKVKRLDLLLEAISHLKLIGENYNLTLIGTGDAESELKKYVNDQFLNKNVWFYGATYNENEISNLIFNADLCISPGNVGLTAIHSMTYGTPVITHDNFTLQMPEFESIAVGKTGDFFRYDDYLSLATCIKNWFSNSKSRIDIRTECYTIVDSKYNPHIQIQTFKKHLV